MDAWRCGCTQPLRPAVLRRTGHNRWSRPLSFSDPASNPCMCWNVGQLSIDYALRPRLRSRLTPGGRTCPGKPWDSGDPDSHRVFRYSCPHNRSCEVHGPSPAPLLPVARRSPTIRKSGSANSVRCLTPDHFRRVVSRVVSCYALFK